MRKAAAILLFSIYLVSTAELYELLKVDVLLEHYKETKARQGNISFVDFLVMHYVTDDGNKNDNDRDEQLPFKSATSVAAAASAPFILQRTEEFTLKPFIEQQDKLYCYSNPAILSHYYGAVWNPPRLPFSTPL
ncbi:hypothetical protein [Ferruginibacter sp.]